MSIQTTLDEVVLSELESLKEMEVTSETYKSTVDNVTRLMDRKIELEKLESEKKEREDSRIAETTLKLKQLEEEKKDRFFKNILAGLGIAVPTGLTIWGTLKSLKFEETGTVTTAAGRNFISKLFSKK